MIVFDVEEKVIPTRPYVMYNSEDYTFSTEEADGFGVTSILFDDINLEIDDQGKLIYIWGLCPYHNWMPFPIEPPAALNGEVRIRQTVSLHPGVSLRLTPVGLHLPTYVNSSNGWVLLQGADKGVKAVSFMPGVIVELTENGELCSLWIRPVNGV